MIFCGVGYSLTCLNFPPNVKVKRCMHLVNVHEQMEICEQSEIFVENGDFVFDHAKIILRDTSGKYFHSQVTTRLFPTVSIDVSKLRPRLLKDFWPPFNTSMTQAPFSPPENHYIKRPSLLFYNDENVQGLSDQISQEVRVCEILRHNQHSTIAKYWGCIVGDDRIKGICFTKYRMDLAKRLKGKRSLNLELFARA